MLNLGNSKNFEFRKFQNFYFGKFKKLSKYNFEK